MKLQQVVKLLVAVLVLAGIAVGGYLTRGTWMPLLRPGKPESPSASASETSPSEVKFLLTEKAIENLNLKASSLKAGPYWKTITVPGSVVDRPGLSDRGLVAQVTGVVSAIYYFPGDTVGPGSKLFTLMIMSETFHQTQSELFKATQDMKAAEKERVRIAPLAGEGIKGSDLIGVENQIARLQVSMKAYRQELQSRGLTTSQIDLITRGEYLKEIDVSIPARPTTSAAEPAPVFEIQELKVELGHQVQAGQTLCLLANHSKLAIEGRAFPDETALLERAVQEGWPVEADFQEPRGSKWKSREQSFPITQLANNIDPERRTFAFLMPLENESRTVERNKRSQLLWRYRPGQKVRLTVKIDKIENVFIVSADAVAREGPEAFVFTQNVNTFERIPVRVLLQARDQVVIDNDGSLPTFLKDKEGLPANAPKEKEAWTIPAIVQNGATQLNRMAKSQTNTVPKGYHVHADGSLHKNEDEGK